MSDTNIPWAEKTWNPVVGCRRVSPGCDHCYAVRMAHRLVAMGQEKYEAVTRCDIFDGGPYLTEWNGLVALDEDALTQPLHWKKPATIFVVSMGDLFYEKVPFEFIDRIFAVMALCPQHTFLLLTKRPERAREYHRGMSSDFGRAKGAFSWRNGEDGWVEAMKRFRSMPSEPLPNVWLGVTAENQEQADKRIPILLDTPAAKRFVSVEPMLSSVDLSRWIGYNPVHENESESRERDFGSTPRRGTVRGQQGQDMADRQARMGPLEETNGVQALQAGKSGTSDSPGIPSDQGDEGPGARLCGGTPNRIPRFGRTDSEGVDDQSQERNQGRQSPVKSGGNDLLGEPATCKPGVRDGAGMSPVGRTESSAQTHGASGDRNPPASSTDSLGHATPPQSPDSTSSPAVRRGLHDGMEYRNKSTLALSWCIVGCESGPGARPTDIQWVRDLREQCVAAGVSYFLKQMVVDGKLVKMPTLDGRVWDQRPEGGA